ncbi:cupin domain-containing protein [Sciscionella sediminilitoris]|uniref:cupin domain-containing protein n=1 Tax=Sciscionella sediminilitoris TaxID=1445613 RepID=UPI0004DF08EB|nr:cupin domain-containing protein [Sciscionella sp. SE31]
MTAALWSGNHDGADFGSGVSLIIEPGAEPGSGPRLHRHPYAETFVIRGGRALFTIGDEQIEGRGGQILVAPANIPHRFTVLETYEAVHIHESERIVTEWLE